MTIWEVFVVAVGLSMDAFAVSVCTGLSSRRVTPGQMGVVGLYFGGFQALMPVAGYLLASTFAGKIQAVDHWVTFGLLAVIGGKMIKESFTPVDCDQCQEPSLHWRTMLPLAVATSIDAMAVGITFAFLDVAILPAAGLIGAVTFFFSVLGVGVGHLFGARFKSKAELVGGIVLIAIGLRILLQHLGILP